jgi:outer membrane lipoprotein LolB
VLINPACIKQFIYVLTLTVLISGCVSAPQSQVKLIPTSHQLSITQQNHWSIKGKLGFKSTDNKQSANLRWQQIEQEYRLNLTSVIGTSVLKMFGSLDNATLITDGKIYTDNDPSDLIRRVTGWQMPVDKLPIWIKGQHQEQDIVLTSEEGWVTQLQPNCANCENWTINYANYQMVKDVWLPHSVELKNKLHKTQLLIKINQWQLSL